VLKTEQEKVAEKAAKVAAREQHQKSEERRRVRGIKTEEEYALRLADEALAAGKDAQHLMQQASEAGSVAAQKLMEAAEVKAAMYREQERGLSGEAAAARVAREATAALLASRAVQQMNAAVSGRPVHSKLPELVAGSAPRFEESLSHSVVQEEAAEAEKHAAGLVPTDRDIEHWASESEMWRQYYKKLYAAKYQRAVEQNQQLEHAVQQELDQPHSHQEVPPTYGDHELPMKMGDDARMHTHSNDGSHLVDDDVFDEKVKILLA